MWCSEHPQRQRNRESVAAAVLALSGIASLVPHDARRRPGHLDPPMISDVSTSLTPNSEALSMMINGTMWGNHLKISRSPLPSTKHRSTEVHEQSCHIAE